jgi:hypothetical protein
MKNFTSLLRVFRRTILVRLRVAIGDFLNRAGAL